MFRNINANVIICLASLAMFWHKYRLSIILHLYEMSNVALEHHLISLVFLKYTVLHNTVSYWQYL